MQRAGAVARPVAAAASSATTSTARGYRHLVPRATVRVVSPYAARRQQHFIRSITTVTILGTFATAWQWYAGNNSLIRDVHAEEPLSDSSAELVFEKPRRSATSKEDNRALISSQHLQVKKSLENPGVYAWGNNTGKVVAPESKETYIKTPRRLSFFDGMLLRDIKLDRDFGAAIDQHGDLLQWGTRYSKEDVQPTATLQGKNLVTISFSKDRIIGLSSNGTVYSIPVSKEEQQNGPKVTEASWIPMWTSQPSISYRTIQPENLWMGEKVSAIASGLDHTLLLTSRGRLFSAASSSDFPRRGQLGIPGLGFSTRPAGAYDQPHEITSLSGLKIKQIAAGDFHSLALDEQGRLFTFGDNSFGQLGFDFSADMAFHDTPTILPTQTLYAGTSQVARITSIAAGGGNSYFTVDATRIADPEADAVRAQRNLGRITADTFAFGHGLWGSLGNGRWTHVQSKPAKIPSLSGLFEYDEKRSKVIPIRLARLSVGATHVAAVMDNVTEVRIGASRYGTENETNWGADIVFFGGNENYQLGTGKRNNASTPTYIQPLDSEGEQGFRPGQEHRFQITPRTRTKVNGRNVEVEQRVVCGRGATAVFSSV